jgi:hypothetical protein
MSPTIHGLITVEATERPRKNRIAMSMPMLLLLAATILKIMKRIFDAWYTPRRPYVSDKGATRSGPTTSPSSHIETKRVDSSLLVEWNSSRIYDVAGAQSRMARFL